MEKPTESFPGSQESPAIQADILLYITDIAANTQLQKSQEETSPKFPGLHQEVPKSLYQQNPLLLVDRQSLSQTRDSPEKQVIVVGSKYLSCLSLGPSL